MCLRREAINALCSENSSSNKVCTSGSQEIGARHQRPVGDPALLPLLLPALPLPHRHQARLPASRAHLLAGA